MKYWAMGGYSDLDLWNQILISSSLSKWTFVQIWRNSLQVFLRYCAHKDRTDIWTTWKHNASGHDCHQWGGLKTATEKRQIFVPLWCSFFNKSNSENINWAIYSFSNLLPGAAIFPTQDDKYLLSTAFLQPVNHLLKLQGGDFHFLLQLIHKRLIFWI